MSELVGFLAPSVEQDPVRRALDCLQEGFQIVGFDWRYLYVNPAAARHGRRSPAELIGRSMMDEYPGIEKTQMFEALHRCMRTRQSEVLENEFTFPDGSARWFELRVQPVPQGICIYSSDIDIRKRRELGAPTGAHGGFIDRIMRRFRRLDS